MNINKNGIENIEENHVILNINFDALEYHDDEIPKEECMESNNKKNKKQGEEYVLVREREQVRKQSLDEQLENIKRSRKRVISKKMVNKIKKEIQGLVF